MTIPDVKKITSGPNSANVLSIRLSLQDPGRLALLTFFARDFDEAEDRLATWSVSGIPGSAADRPEVSYEVSFENGLFFCGRTSLAPLGLSDSGSLLRETARFALLFAAGSWRPHWMDSKTWAAVWHQADPHTAVNARHVLETCSIPAVWG